MSGVGNLSITLHDTYQAAYLCYSGLDINYIWSNGMVLFEFTGVSAAELADEYLTGHDNINAALFSKHHRRIRTKLGEMKREHSKV